MCLLLDDNVCKLNSPGQFELLLFHHLLSSVPLIISQYLADNTLCCLELAGGLELSPIIHLLISKLYEHSLERY